MKRLIAVSAVALLFAAAPFVSSAATIVLTATQSQVFDGATFAPLGNPANVQAGQFVEIDVSMTLNGAAADQDFWTAIFNVNVSPKAGSQSTGFTPVDLGAGFWNAPGTAAQNGLYVWRTPNPPPATASYATYDNNGATPGGVVNHWQNGNADVGSNVNDLQVIAVEATAAEANNRQYGETPRPKAGFGDQLGSPTLIGSVLFQAVANGTYDVTVTPIAGAPWGIYSGNTTGAGTTSAQQAAGFSGVAATVTVGVPEPASLALMSLGALAMVGYGIRRRTA